MVSRECGKQRVPHKVGMAGTGYYRCDECELTPARSPTALPKRKELSTLDEKVDAKSSFQDSLKD